MNIAGKTGLVLVWVGSLAIALISYRFLALGLEQAFPGLGGHISNRPLMFVLHISAAPIALAVGLFQFLPGLRSRRPALHRWSGRLYAMAILVSGFAGLVLAIQSPDRPVAAVGFGLLAVAWLGMTARAVQLARAGRIAEHRQWMIRSFALTFAAVTLRLYLPLFFFVGDMEYSEASNYVAWLCWVPNILVAEIYLRNRRTLTAEPARVATSTNRA